MGETCPQWRRLRWGAELWNVVIVCELPDGHPGDEHRAVIDEVEISWKTRPIQVGAAGRE